MSQQQRNGDLIARAENIPGFLQNHFQQSEFEKRAHTPELVNIQRLMRLDGLDELVEGRCRESSFDRLQVEPGDSSYAGLVFLWTENDTWEPAQFLALIGNVTYRGSEHSVTRSKLEERGSSGR